MSTVVRVKRRLDEEPSSALVVSCKRRKRVDEDGDAVETVFKFAGTYDDQNESIAVISPEKLKNGVKNTSRPVPNLKHKARTETKAASRSSRYKFVNYFRTVKQEDKENTEEDCKSDSITILEVESNCNERAVLNNVEGETSNTSQYVYDLYYIQPDAEDIDVNDLFLDGLVSIAPVEHELVFDSYRSNKACGRDSDSDSPLMDDDDDSNDENNWRNDYPDEEECGSGSDDAGDLGRGLNKIRFGDGELSSDDDDERLIYSEELSLSDVNMYGSAYARFKKEALKDLDSCTEIHSNSDEDYNNCRSDLSINEDASDAES